MKVNSITIKQNEVMNRNMHFMYTPKGLIPQDIFIKTVIGIIQKHSRILYKDILSCKNKPM